MARDFGGGAALGFMASLETPSGVGERRWPGVGSSGLGWPCGLGGGGTRGVARFNHATTNAGRDKCDWLEYDRSWKWRS
jgi:hypothetical protein